MAESCRNCYFHLKPRFCRIANFIYDYEQASAETDPLIDFRCNRYAPANLVNGRRVIVGDRPAPQGCISFRQESEQECYARNYDRIFGNDEDANG